MSSHRITPAELLATGITREEAIRRLAYENEIARRRRLNNIPDGFLTPDWLELAVAKDWSLVRGEPSESRARAEAEARRAFDDADLLRLSKGQRAFERAGIAA